jgi:hypothetical protein
MDAFLRQAYADGMLDDHSHIAPDPIEETRPALSISTEQISSVNVETLSLPVDPPNELILLSDDDADDSFQLEIPQLPPLSFTETLSSCSTSKAQSDTITVSLPYTYLSLIQSQIVPSNKLHEDYSIKGCFSSLVTNPRLIKNEFDLQAYLNDGSACLLVRLASDLLAQRIGITVTQLMAKRKECKNDMDKQKFQADFNERLKKFGHGMAHLNAMMTIRFFSDNQTPMVIDIDEN